MLSLRSTLFKRLDNFDLLKLLCPAAFGRWVGGSFGWLIGLGAAVRICAVATAAAKNIRQFYDLLTHTDKMRALKIIEKDYLCENSIGYWRYVPTICVGALVSLCVVFAAVCQQRCKAQHLNCMQAKVITVLYMNLCVSVYVCTCMYVCGYVNL